MNRRQFLAAAGVFAVQQRINLRRLDVSIADIALLESAIDTVPAPSVQNVRNYRAFIMWATQSPGIGGVQYSVDGVNYKNVPAIGRTFQPSETFMSAPFTQYRAVLPRLLPGTQYVYS